MIYGFSNEFPCFSDYSDIEMLLLILSFTKDASGIDDVH